MNSEPRDSDCNFEQIPDNLGRDMQGRVSLEIIDGPLKGRKFEFAEHDTFIFGRAPDCHAQLSDDTHVSRHHFILEVNPPLARLRDLGSLNGIYVKSRKHGSRQEDETPGQTPGPLRILTRRAWRLLTLVAYYSRRETERGDDGHPLV